MQVSDQENSVFAEAFENDLVREGIFQYLSTSELLSTCSLVSKNWNAKVRSFIYFHRKCTPINNPEVNVCQFLENINQLCHQMIAQGRTVPFNRLNLRSSRICPQDLQEQKNEANLETAFVLKHLQAFVEWYTWDCGVHRPLSTLFSHRRRSDLRSLAVGNFLRFGKILDQSGWVKPFTKLQELIIVGDCYNPEQDVQAMKDIVASLLKLAPNLAGITVLRSEALRLIPEEKYGLLKNLEFLLSKTEDMDIFRKIANQSCHVKELFIHDPPAFNHYTNGEIEENFDIDFRHEFKTTVQQLVQSCQNSLRSISIKGGYLLGQLSQGPLTKLRKFKMEKRYHDTTQEFWEAIASVDYARVAPQLQEIEIVMSTWKWTSNEVHELGYDAEREWPENSENFVIHGCTTIRKLTLEVLVAKINMALLKSFLPNVTELELRVNHTASIETEGDLPDISQIFQLWPGLKQLTIAGEQNILKRSYDPDFCGIHAEEVELLMEMDENYLQAVHIVPLRPCLCTMTGKNLYIYVTKL